MEYEFYLDLFFLADCLFNLLSLFLTAAFVRKETCACRMILAAAIGSFWNCFLIIFPVLPVGMELVLTIFAAGSVMCGCAFPSLMLMQAEKLLMADFALMASSALVSGCFSFAREHFYLSDTESLMFISLICLPAQRLIKRMLKRGKIGAERCYVRLYYQGKMKEFLALADSGNRLRVPDTGKPVSLISFKDCTGFCDKVSGGFYIPYRSVGTEKGFLFAVVFEKMEITRDGRTMTIEHPAVAITRESLSTSGDFSMILPEEYVPGE